MILSKKKIANIENRLNELDNVNRHIQLDIITDLETPIKKPGTDIVLYGLYYRVSLQDRFNNIIEQTELKEDLQIDIMYQLKWHFTTYKME